jgi:hypothetical protein
VIRRVKEGFVALALKAPLVNNLRPAGNEDEAKIYRHLKKCMLAPQGIGVLDSDGRVRAWVQMFESDQAVLDFLDRFRDKGPAEAQCYLRYPDQKHKEVDDDPFELSSLAHPEGELCPAEGAAKAAGPKGSLACYLVGRALTNDGKLHEDTVNQEHYSQDQFVLSKRLQRQIAEALDGAKRARLPEEFGKLCATYAHLGHIDVRPMLDTNRGKIEECEFWASRGGDGLWGVEGKTAVQSELKTNAPGEHQVRLEWKGFLRIEGDRIESLLLSAEGTAKLKWGSDRPEEEEVRHLPGGRPLDFSGEVRFGVVGKPIVRDGPETPEGPPASLQQKMQKLQAAVQRRSGDLSDVGRIMERFQPLMEQGRFDEAERVLDEALKRLQ